jgi:hypothetical protein
LLPVIGYVPEMGDTYTRTGSGGELLVIKRHPQVIMVRPNGTMLNLLLDSNGKTNGAPSELTLDQFVNIARALDTNALDL